MHAYIHTYIQCALWDIRVKHTYTRTHVYIAWTLRYSWEYAHTYTCIHICESALTEIDVKHVCPDTHTHTHTYIHTHRAALTDIDATMHTHTYMYTTQAFWYILAPCMYTHINTIFTCVYTYINTYSAALKDIDVNAVKWVCVCVWLYMDHSFCVCMYGMTVCLCVWLCVCVCARVCMTVCVCVCVTVCVFLEHCVWHSFYIATCATLQLYVLVDSTLVYMKS
jgi:hypothetical protein